MGTTTCATLQPYQRMSTWIGSPSRHVKEKLPTPGDRGQKGKRARETAADLWREIGRLISRVFPNVTALYRRAQGYTALVDLELAEFDIKKALEIDPHNRYTKFRQQPQILCHPEWWFILFLFSKGGEGFVEGLEGQAKGSTLRASPVTSLKKRPA
jgi:hypothetical protein